MLPINEIICGDFRKICSQWPLCCVDMIFTDPPYIKEGIPLYEDVAKTAKMVVKNGGFVFTYASDYWLHKTFPKMCQHLDYFYLFHLLNHGAHASIFPRKLFAASKSILGFSHRKPVLKKWVSNLVPVSPRVKEHREDNWEQKTKDAEYFIDGFSNENDIILDPMCGSGTTCVAAKELGRNYIGIDISEKYCKVSRERLNATNK